MKKCKKRKAFAGAAAIISALIGAIASAATTDANITNQNRLAEEQNKQNNLNANLNNSLSSMQNQEAGLNNDNISKIIDEKVNNTQSQSQFKCGGKRKSKRKCMLGTEDKITSLKTLNSLLIRK